MTLVVTIHGPKTVWVLSDRRLSSGRRIVREDACKMMCLETMDGVAILAYAGLGATRLGTQPSDWMSAVLRGRSFLTMERSLSVLFAAFQREIPKQLRHFQGHPGHSIRIPAFINDQLRFFVVEAEFDPTGGHYLTRHVRLIAGPHLKSPETPRVSIAGSGRDYVKKGWDRRLLRLANACDRGQLSPAFVAGHLAALNHETHCAAVATGDQSVGDRSIVAWCHPKGSGRGGAHRCYTGLRVDAVTPSLPTIANGMDVQAIIEMMAGRGNDIDAIRAGLAQLPDAPDEALR